MKKILDQTEKPTKLVHPGLVTDWLWIISFALSGVYALQLAQGDLRILPSIVSQWILEEVDFKPTMFQTRALMLPVKTPLSSQTPKKATSEDLRLLAPISGAQFNSAMRERISVVLKWAPIDSHLDIELDLRRVDDPEFMTHPTLTPTGTIVELPDGMYAWRIRTKEGTEVPSAWSSFKHFMIREHVVEPKSLLLGVKKEH